MNLEGATHYVSGRDPVPLPTGGQHITPHDPLVLCRCKLRLKPGAFHICLDLTTPEPPPARPSKPKPQPKPKAAPKSNQVGRPRALSDEQANEVARLYTAGATLDVVAEFFGVSRKAVQNILDRLEVPRRRPGPYVAKREKS